jgi:hypothetical protein
MKIIKPKPSIEKLNEAYRTALAQNPETASFVVDGVEYRRVTIPDAPELAGSPGRPLWAATSSSTSATVGVSCGRRRPSTPAI